MNHNDSQAFIQNSFVDHHEGILYLVATPIGNLEDMTARAISILREVDIIAAEDTRQGKKLLNAYAINTQLISYHEHNKDRKGEYILHELESGKKIALISDAGLPGVSDPGADIAKLAIEHKIPVVPIPGVSASLTSLIASGLPTDRFLFYGFLDRHKGKRKKELETLKILPYSIIFYESPHRIMAMLEDLLSVLGDRQISIGRELTKKFEQFIRGPISFCIEVIEKQKIQGEFTVIMEGASKEELEEAERSEQWWLDYTILEHIDRYIEKGQDVKEAIKLVAKDRGVSKRDIYQEYHKG